MKRTLLASAAWALLSSLAILPEESDGNEPALVSSTACRRMGKSACGRWDVAESANLRFLHHGQGELAVRLGAALEATRASLFKRWLPRASHDPWRPKCDIFLCADGAEFTRVSGFPADTRAVSHLEVGDGRVWRRRIDVRADDEAKIRIFLEHEMVHVILADRFHSQRIPRWADEGIAVLCEPAGRREEFEIAARAAHKSRSLPTARSLMSNSDYPRDRRAIDIFYGQSASLVEFLVAPRGEAAFVDFVEASLSIGVDRALKAHYGLESAESLEAAWRIAMPRGRTHTLSVDKARQQGRAAFDAGGSLALSP